jgi:Xaa-Pro aminopeptidase
MTDRIVRLRGQLEDPLLVTDPTNVRYLTGFQSSNCALLVEQGRTRLFTDFRYAESARAVPDVEPVITRRNLIGELAEILEGRIAFERVLPYGLYEVLRDGGVDLVPTSGKVESLRAVKDEQELGALRRACAITDRVFERLTDVPFVGRTEREVSWDLTRLFVEEGGEGLAFESIVGAGPTGARPHARAGNRKIGAGELVVIDAGTTVDGYASDYTRTFATGPLDGEAKEAYDTVLAAQEAALEGIRAGISGVDADALARGVIDGSAFKGKLGHGLGHGLGLDVHEAPKLSTESSDTLVPGNVVTVEPGIYLEGRYGIRIEDDVVVTEDGIENLTGFRKDLIEVR